MNNITREHWSSITRRDVNQKKQVFYIQSTFTLDLHRIPYPFIYLNMWNPYPFIYLVWKRYPFQEEPPYIGHYREVPTPGGGTKNHPPGHDFEITLFPFSTLLIISITKYYIMFGSSHTYLRAITWVSNHWYPITKCCNWIPFPICMSITCTLMVSFLMFPLGFKTYRKCYSLFCSKGVFKHLGFN